MRTTVYLKPQKPTPAHVRLTFAQVAKLTYDAGFCDEPQHAHAEMVATFRAESTFDPLACLCYVRIPGSPGKIERWEADAKRFSISGKILPIPNYLLANATWKADVERDASYFQRQIYWRNVAFVRYIPADGALAPGYPDLQSWLNERYNGTGIAHHRILFEQTESGQDRIDFGLPQLNSQHHKITFDIEKQCRVAYGLYQARDFAPWVSHTKGLHLPFMADAQRAVRLLRSMV